MAGIHLPDIGKLGIHIATGINDKKKVSPLNMIENARLKAISKKIDSEKKNRYRIFKNEQKMMKMRDKRIRKRLDDINRSRTIFAGKEKTFESQRIARLPPLDSTKKTEKESCIVEDDRFFKNATVPSSPFVFFPIHEELGSLKCLHSDGPTIPAAAVDGMGYQNKKVERLKDIRLKDREINDRLNVPTEPRGTCRCPMNVDHKENVINYASFIDYEASTENSTLQAGE